MINDTFGTVFSRKQVFVFVAYYKYKPVYKITHELPVNAERIRRGGHIYIKVSTDGPHKQAWKEKHRWVWEQANGKIPEGMCIIFLDNNTLNCTLENLAMVSMSENLVMSQRGLYTNNPEATLAGIAIARHLLAVHGFLKKKIGTEEHNRFIYRVSARKAKRKRQLYENGIYPANPDGAGPAGTAVTGTIGGP
jgi:hypothetical protein